MYPFDSTTLNRTREARYQIKKKYMYDYFSVRYQPGFNQDGTPSKEYPCILKLVPIQNDHSENYRSKVKLSFINAEKALNFVYYPNIELKQIHGIPIVKYNNNNQQTYSIMTITSKAGMVYLPNEVYDFESLKNSRSYLIPMRLTLDRKVIQVVPEKRIGFDQPESSTSGHAKHTQMVETLVVYDYPCFAKCIHWVLVNIFRVKPLTVVEEEEINKNINPGSPKRIFRDFTSNSDPSIPMDYLESLPVQGRQSYKGNYPPPTLNHIIGAPVEILRIESNLKNEDSGPSAPATAAMDSQLGASSSSQQQDSSFKNAPSGLSMSGSDELKASLPPISKKMRDGKEKETRHEPSSNIYSFRH